MVVLGRPKSGRGAGGDLLGDAGAVWEVGFRVGEEGEASVLVMDVVEVDVPAVTTVPLLEYSQSGEFGMVRRRCSGAEMKVRSLQSWAALVHAHVLSAAMAIYDLSAVMEKRRLRLGKAVYQDLNGEAELDEQGSMANGGKGVEVAFVSLQPLAESKRHSEMSH
ncbi:hypothetical protein ZWY2020_014463 [Hordeum vulgare]|nr:hypothetical protein ZWY2020_014463 [Hordeum vulgare]